MTNAQKNILIRAPHLGLGKMINAHHGDYLAMHLYLMKEYGDIARMPLQKSQFSIFEPLWVKQILLTNEHNYDKQEFTYEAVRKVMGLSLLTTSDKNDWRALRQQLQPLFQPNSVANWRIIIAEEIEQLINRWDGFAEKQIACDLAYELQRLVLRISQRTLLGEDLLEHESLLLSFGTTLNCYARSGFYKLPWLPTQPL